MVRRVLMGAALASLVVVMILPVVTSADVLYLKDGTRLVGEILGWEGDSVLVGTAFSERPIRLHRGQIERIQIGDAPEAPPPPATTDEPVIETPAAPPDTGILHIVMAGSELSSTVRFRRRSYRDDALALNTIVFLVYLDGQLIFEDRDDEMDKEMVRGGETEIRNKFKKTEYRIPAPAGVRRLRVYLGNESLSEGKFRNGKDILAVQVAVDAFVIDPDVETLLKLVGKKGFLGLGSQTLVWESGGLVPPDREE